MGTVVVFAGGPSPSEEDLDLLRRRMDSIDRDLIDLVVAADSGLELAASLGWTPVPGRDLVVGDMDSVDVEALARAESSGVKVERFPPDKDATDLEIAVDEAVLRAGPSGRIVLVGTVAGRFDHVLSMVSVLASAGPVAERLAWLGGDRIHVVDAVGAVPTGTGSTFSVIPVGGDAAGVTVTGARWELRGETLPSGSSRGMSNEATREVVDVVCLAGTVLVVVPGESS